MATNFAQMMGNPNNARPPAHNMLINHYRQQQPKPNLQPPVSVEDRSNLAMQIMHMFKLLKPEAQMQELIRLAVQHESGVYGMAQSKEHYIVSAQSKLSQIRDMREQMLRSMQANPNNQMNAMNAAQMGMMGQPNLQGPRQNTPQQMQQGFPNPQLQQQMRPSPIPMSQSQSSMGITGGSAANTPQMPNNAQPGMQQPAQQHNAMVMNLARRLMEQARPEIRAQFEQEVNTWPEDKKQQLLSKGINPLLVKFRQQAEMMLKTGKLNPQQLAMLQRQTQPNMMAGGMQQGQQLGQMPHQQNGMNQRQPGQEFDFTALANQQSEAIRVQDQGQQVVPASNNAMGTQMGSFPGQMPQPGQLQRQPQGAFQNVNALQRQAAQVQVQNQQQRAQQIAVQQQQQQRNTNQLLQGQPGGLNLAPGATPNANPMSMLNRAMPPPGQANPSTPQTRPQAHVPVMAQQNQGQMDPQITQLMHDVSQRAANLRGPLTEQVRAAMIPVDWDPMVRQQLLKVPDEQFRAIILQRLGGNANGRRIVQNPGFPGGQIPPGAPGMMINQPQQLSVNGLPNGLMNGGVNLGNMRPGGALGPHIQNGMGGQQMGMGQRPMLDQQRFMQATQLLQKNPGIIQFSDPRPFPPNILSAQMREMMPADVKSWAQLKQWAQQHPNVISPEERNKFVILQVIHFQEQLAAQQQQNNAAGQRPPQVPNGMGGMAPAAQMTPGALPGRMPNQQQVNMGNPGQMQVTPQELLAMRQRLHPNQTNVSDDQLRNFIITQKMNARIKQQQQLMGMQAARNPNQPLQNAMAGQGMQPARPLPMHNQQPATALNTKQGGQTPQQNAQGNLNKGLKRPNEDSSETATDGQPSTAAVQAPAMAPSRSQQAQLLHDSLMEAQNVSNKQPDALNKQADGSSKAPFILTKEELAAKMKDPEREKHFRQMFAEENEKIPKHPTTVTVPQDARTKIQLLIRENMGRIKKVEHAVRLYMITAEGTGADKERMAREVLRSRILLQRQLNLQDGSLLPELTMSEAEMRHAIKQMVDLVNKAMFRIEQAQGQGPRGQPNQQRGQNQAAGVAQLNEANLKIMNEQAHSRGGHKVPSAPIATQPPFQIGGASPQGAPKYFEGVKTLTHLSLPEKKRQKMDTPGQTPASGPKQSPHMNSAKGSSPEMKRRMAMDTASQKPTFNCDHPECGRGFNTQAELTSHRFHTHEKTDDPTQFALDSMAAFVDVDAKTGQPKQGAAGAPRGSRPLPAAGRAAQQSIKPGQTPSMSQNAATPADLNAATPMTRVPTQTGVKSSPSTSLLKTPQTTAKVATPSTGGAFAKATPASTGKALAKGPETQVDTAVAPEQELQPLVPMNLFDFSYDDIYATLDSAPEPLTVLDFTDEDNSWALRSRPSSPLNTPDSTSKDTPSTRQSDISENDNLHINLNIKDSDVPDVWMAAMHGEPHPIDTQLSKDLQTLGVTLPTFSHGNENDDFALFYPDLMDFDAMDSTMPNFDTGLDPAVLGVSA